MKARSPAKGRAGGYRDVMAEIQSKITRSVLRPGDRLPTIAEAARQYSVNGNTVLRAFAELKRDGFVETRGRNGSFVSDRWLTARVAGASSPESRTSLGRLHVGLLTSLRPGGGAPSGQATVERLLVSRFCAEGGRLEHLFLDEASDG